MPTAAAFDREKLEVEAVLASGIFNRAPNLAQLLTYVCAKYFDGSADEIKEYNIAVEALGRPPEFDQKRDSIVRVEAHRLRKRLKEFYEGAGAVHPVRIEIPSGQYTPHFIFTALAEPLPATEVSIEPETVPVVHETALVPATIPLPAPSQPAALPALPQAATSPTRWPWILALAGVVAVAGFIVVADRKRPDKPVIPFPQPELSRDSGEDIRILAGVESGGYVDAFERTWQSDRYYSGGWSSQAPRLHPVLGTRDQRMYQTKREGAFKYDIPLKPGTYELKLHFAETVFGDNNVAGGGETTRMFVVSANGKSLLNEFDVIGEVGSAVADVKVFKNVSPAADGKLHLEFTPQTNPAFVNAIEVVPSAPGRIRPIRIVARDRGIKDSKNRYWDPDRYAQGGQVIARPESNVRDAEPELFRSERFGNITYSIPVAPNGRYGITLYFTENWFGPGMPGGGGVGRRIFDILVNGIAVKRNYDIFKESGGTGHSTTVSLHGVEPNHQGKILIWLTPARNYACINALEVVDETK